jgi:hypothetical protein
MLWHDWSRHVFHLPHPNPLPEGEGAKLERFALPSPSGRGSEGERSRARILFTRKVSRRSRIPVLPSKWRTDANLGTNTVRGLDP